MDKIKSVASTMKRRHSRNCGVFGEIPRTKIFAHWSRPLAAGLWTLGFILCQPFTSHADDTNSVTQQLQELRQANAVMQQQMHAQQGVIEALGHQVADLQAARAERDRQLAELKEGLTPPPAQSGINLGNVHIGGEAGVAFFNTGSAGFAPNAEFRIDEAKLFIEAPIWENVYLYSELNLAQREFSDLYLNVGELYLDFQDVSLLWNQERQLNIRAGRLDVPFGEEYITRDAIDNPLISHSLSDFWGVDEGVELYGAFGKFSYAVAVQNGGIPDTRDFNSDKSVTARIGFDPNKHWHFSVSAMRTGNLDVSNDGLSALWFGGGYFKPLDYSATLFHADLLEADTTFRWMHGHVSAFGGVIYYDDNAAASMSKRTVYFYSVEAQQQLARKLYIAARFSQLLAKNGFPIIGNGAFNNYFFGPLTDELWRASLGLGYRFSEHLLLKTEYTFEGGHETGGNARNQEDLFSVEAALKF